MKPEDRFLVHKGLPHNCGLPLKKETRKSFIQSGPLGAVVADHYLFCWTDRGCTRKGWFSWDETNSGWVYDGEAI